LAGKQRAVPVVAVAEATHTAGGTTITQEALGHTHTRDLWAGLKQTHCLEPKALHRAITRC
jgi:hypothetical protein